MSESDLPASPGLVIRALESNVQRFLEAGIAESTMKVYRAGCSRYQTFATCGWNISGMNESTPSPPWRMECVEVTW